MKTGAENPMNAANGRPRHESGTRTDDEPKPSRIKRGLTRLLRRLFFLNSNAKIPERMFRHAVAGGAATLLYMTLVALQVEVLRMHPVLAIVTASIVMELFIYVAQRFWVYESTRHHSSAIPRFLVTIPIALGLNAGIMALVVDVLGLWYVWGLVAATLILPPTNFLLNIYWVFR
jgi:putative flippase GtrA